jgi:hypothetical protein
MIIIKTPPCLDEYELRGRPRIRIQLKKKGGLSKLHEALVDFCLGGVNTHQKHNPIKTRNKP